MDAHDDKPGRSAFWCGVLNGDARPVVAGAVVRTVRGAYTAARARVPKHAGGLPKPSSWPRRA
jgi:hypothetical protein